MQFIYKDTNTMRILYENEPEMAVGPTRTTIQHRSGLEFILGAHSVWE